VLELRRKSSNKGTRKATLIPPRTPMLTTEELMEVRATEFFSRGVENRNIFKHHHQNIISIKPLIRSRQHQTALTQNFQSEIWNRWSNNCCVKFLP